MAADNQWLAEMGGRWGKGLSGSRFVGSPASRRRCALGGNLAQVGSMAVREMKPTEIIQARLRAVM
jgi:hypothetical protein